MLLNCYFKCFCKSVYIFSKLNEIIILSLNNVSVKFNLIPNVSCKSRGGYLISRFDVGFTWLAYSMEMRPFARSGCCPFVACRPAWTEKPLLTGYVLSRMWKTKNANVIFVHDLLGLVYTNEANINRTNIADSAQTCRSCLPFVTFFQEAKRLSLSRCYVSVFLASNV